MTTGSLRDDLMSYAPAEKTEHAGLTGRQLRDLSALVLMLLGSALLMGALAAVDIRLAVGTGGVLLLGLGVLLAVERSPKG